MSIYTKYSDKIPKEKGYNFTVSEKMVYNLGFFDCDEIVSKLLKGIENEIIQNRPDDFKLRNIKRMLEDFNH